MPSASEPLLIIAHRGASADAPENTLTAFEAAWRQGADGIEADFRLSSDGHIVCLHDADTARVAGRKLQVAETSLAELRSLDVGSRRGPGFTGCTIPTLEEVLDLVPPDRLFFLEIKTGPELLAPLARALRRSAVTQDQLSLLAFSTDVMAAARAQLPEVNTLWLTDYRRDNEAWQPTPAAVLETLRRIGATGLDSQAHDCVDGVVATALREAGFDLHFWTVDELATAQRLSGLGAASLTTNRPGWLRRQLADAGTALTGNAVPTTGARRRRGNLTEQ